MVDSPSSYVVPTKLPKASPPGLASLRALSDSCDVLRSVIETRKDQMESLDWAIRIRPTDDKRNDATDDQKQRIEAITSFLQSPDRESNWAQWLRQLLEDMFVIDAASLYKRRDRLGRLYALEIIDGATIKLLLDDTGRRPLPPDPAFQQILKGIPAVDYTADELHYLVHNPRSYKVYGYSHVEQIIVTVNIAIRRALYQLDYYREGSLPDAFGTLPEGWTIDQIKTFQGHFDSLMAGNGANRRRLRFMPAKFDYKEAKQPPLKDAYDEWLARLICHVFSVSPEPFVSQVNRATAETSNDRALQEGLAPLQRWVKAIVDRVIVDEFGSADLEFAWYDDREMDPKQAADINVAYVNARILAADEVREDLGRNPLGGEYAKPFDRASPFGEQAEQEDDEDEGKKKESDPTGTKKAAYTRLRKAAGRKPIPFDRPVTRRARKALRSNLTRILQAVREEASQKVRTELEALGKDAIDDEINRQKGKRIADSLDLSALAEIVDAVPDDLEAVLASTGSFALAQMGVAERSDLVDQVNEQAVAYARQRSAEMIGKRWVDGVLVDNPDARWRIDEATREELRSIITQGLDDNLGADAIVDAIENASAFSEERAELIANTEIARANSEGSLEGYRAASDAGVDVKKAWLADAEACEVCQANADAGAIDLDEDFPSGDSAPPGHPRCECAIVPIVGDE